MDNQKLTQEQYLDAYATMLNSLKKDVSSLTSAVQASNFLALANNAMLDENTRKFYLDRALTLMGIHSKEQEQAEKMFR